MPWFLYHIAFSRPSRRCIVERVFRSVMEDTNEPVTIVLDIASDEDFATSIDVSSLTGALEGVTNSVRQEGATMGLSSLKPRQLVKEIKHYVADAQVARCLFAASAGLMFQELHLNEPRLTVLVAGELSVETAKKYLKHLRPTEEVKDDHLESFQRTFSRLMDYSAEADKDAYAERMMDAEVAKVGKSFNCVSAPLHPSSPHPVKKLYEAALTKKKCIDPRDILAIGGLSEEQFATHFVKTGIFQQTTEGAYKLQFDVSRRAVATVLASMEG